MPGSPIHRGRFPAPPPNLPRLVSQEPVGDVGLDRLGLSTPLFIAGPGARQVGQPQITNNTTVNVPPSPAPAVPRTGIAGPQNDEERALVNQGGWAGASAAVQPLLGDWRTSPLQVISAALGGYNQGRYGAQQDLAANRQKQLELQAAQEELQMRRDAVAAKQKQAAMLEAQIAKLPPDQQDKVRMLYGLGATEQAAKVISPEAEKPMQVGNDVVVRQPNGSFESVYHAPFAPQAPREARVTWRTLSPDEVAKAGYAPGTMVGMSSRGEPRVLQSPKGGGFQIDFDTEGRPSSISMGGQAQQSGGVSGSIPLTGPVRNKVSEDTIGLQDQLARLNQIGAGFKSDWLKIGPRAGAAITAGMEKLGMETSEADRQALGEYTTFRSDSAANLSALLKEQSGAAVTPQEAERANKYIPNAGTGITDGDSPTEFAAKLNAGKDRAKAAIRRKTYLQIKGIPFDFAKGQNGGLELEDIPRKMQEEGDRIHSELVAKGVPEDQAQQQTLQELKRLFGA